MINHCYSPIAFRGLLGICKRQALSSSFGCFVLLNSVHLAYEVRMILFKSPHWIQHKCLSGCMVEENDQNVFLSIVCIPLPSSKLTRKLRTPHRGGQCVSIGISCWVTDVRCALGFSGFLGLILQLCSPDKGKEKCPDGISLDFWSTATRLVLGVLILALWVFLPKVVQL